MTRSPALVVHAALLFLFGLAISGCGGSMNMGARQMQTLTITPASADAMSFPGGKVQFTATATFNMAPMTVMSPAVLWSIGNPFSAPMSSPAASIDVNGVAVCNGFVGNAIIEATAPAEPEIPLGGMTPSTPVVTSTATMICP